MKAQGSCGSQRSVGTTEYQEEMSPRCGQCGPPLFPYPFSEGEGGADEPLESVSRETKVRVWGQEGTTVLGNLLVSCLPSLWIVILEAETH